MTPAADRLTSELIAAVHVLKALHEPDVVPSVERRTARNRLFALADKLEAELSKPLAVKEWTPWTPHNSAGTAL